MNHPRTLGELPELLTAAGYHSSIADEVRRLLEGNDAPLISFRVALEQVFRYSAELEKAVRFAGNPQNFGELLNFARSRNWLTGPEHRFVSALYGLLSDAGAHPGDSKIQHDFAKHALFQSIYFVVSRIDSRSFRPFAGYGGSAGRLRIADEFLKGIRTGQLQGPAMKVEFDQDLMQLTRQRLIYSDIKPLMSIVSSDDASAHLRVLCASLVLSPRCYRKPKDENWPRTVSALDAYSRERLKTLPWQVSRAIALAIANRTNQPDRLLDYLDWIGGDPHLIEENLVESDEYHGGQENAMNYYTSRIQKAEIPLSGCVWETYYIAHRASATSGGIVNALDRRLAELGPGRIRDFFQSMRDLLRQKQKSTFARADARKL